MIVCARAVGKNESNPNLLRLFHSRLFDNVRIIIVASSLRSAQVFEDYPYFALSPIDHYDVWSEAILTEVAAAELASWSETLPALAVFAHHAVSRSSAQFTAETGRQYDLSPALFVEFVLCARRLLTEYHDRRTTRLERLGSALTDLTGAEEKSKANSIAVAEVEPALQAKAKEAAELAKQLEESQRKYDQLVSEISVEQNTLEQREADAQALNNEIQEEIKRFALPLEQSVAALKGLNRADVTDLRSFRDPPPSVKTVMEVICILAEVEPTWKASTSLLGDLLFVHKITAKYSESKRMPMPIMKRVQAYVDSNPNFQESEVSRVSVAGRAFCVWATALYNYEVMITKLEPKQQKAKAATEAVKTQMESLEKKRGGIKDLEANLQNTQAAYKRAARERVRLDEEISDSRARVTRATKLSALLGLDQKKWEEEREKIKSKEEFAIGDNFLCAAFLTYFGPLPPHIRRSLTKQLLNECRERQVQVTPHFNFISALGDPLALQSWHSHGLPRDDHTIENAIILAICHRAPLIIDPDHAASDFLKSLPDQIVCLTPTTPFYTKTIEGSVRLGSVVILEEVPLTIDPAIEGFVANRTFHQDGKLFLKLGDRALDCSEKYRLYLTTSIPDPEFGPEVFARATVIDCALTTGAVAASALTKVLEEQNPSLASRTASVNSRVTEDLILVATLDERVIDLLCSAGERLLDDEERVNEIESTASERTAVAARLSQEEYESEKATREASSFAPIAARLGVLFEVIPLLRRVSPLYSFSVEFIQSVAEQALRSGAGEARVTNAVFSEISRGVLESHRLILALFFAVALLMGEKKISEADWVVFVQGSPPLTEMPANPIPERIPTAVWESVNNVSHAVPQLGNLVNRMLIRPDEFLALLAGERADLPSPFGEGVGEFQKLCFFREVAPAKLPHGIKRLITTTLGPESLSPVAVDLQRSSQFARPDRPVLFIEGDADAYDALVEFAGSAEMRERLLVRAMSPSVTQRVEKELQTAATKGDWVFLKNLENTGEWMVDFEGILDKISGEAVHQDFRLFISAQFGAVLPRNLVRRCVKVALSKPRTIKSVARNLLQQVPREELQDRESCRIGFALAFFHGMLFQRQRFGRIGFRSKCDFVDADFRLAFQLAKKYMGPQYPYAKVRYLIGEVIYGSRTNDPQDRQLINVLLARMLCAPEDIAESAIFPFPAITNTDEVFTFLESLSPDDPPAIVGLHRNSEFRAAQLRTIAVSSQLSRFVFRNAPSHAELAGKVLPIINDVDGRIPEFDEVPSQNDPDGHTPMDPLAKILSEEARFYCRLIQTMRSSLNELTRVLQSTTPLSQTDRATAMALLSSTVPEKWSEFIAIPLKLNPWITELKRRIDFFNNWIRRGPPVVTPLSVFSEPSAFLTAIRHKFLRNAGTTQEAIEFNAEIVPGEPSRPSETGVYLTGLFFEGARWDLQARELAEQQDSVIFSPAPCIHLIPVASCTQTGPRYFQCPLFSLLHSDGDVECKGPLVKQIISVPIPTSKTGDFWILRGASLLLSTDELGVSG
jgi:dynein heavy chain